MFRQSKAYSLAVNHLKLSIDSTVTVDISRIHKNGGQSSRVECLPSPHFVDITMLLVNAETELQHRLFGVWACIGYMSVLTVRSDSLDIVGTTRAVEYKGPNESCGHLDDCQR